MIVCKVGKTNNLEQRLSDHDCGYGKMKNVDLQVKCCEYIESSLTHLAESDLLKLFNDMGIIVKHDIYRELIVISKNKLSRIIKYYQEIGTKYSGQIKFFKDKIKDMEHQHEVDILKKDNMILALEKDKEHCETKIEMITLKKDREHDNTKKELESLKQTQDDAKKRNRISEEKTSQTKMNQKNKFCYFFDFTF